MKPRYLLFILYLPWASTTIKIMVDPILMIKLQVINGGYIVIYQHPLFLMVVGSSQGLLYTPHLQINRQLQRRLELPVCQQDEVNIRNLCATEPDDVHQDLDDYFENQ